MKTLIIVIYFSLINFTILGQYGLTKPYSFKGKVKKVVYTEYPAEISKNKFHSRQILFFNLKNQILKAEMYYGNDTLYSTEKYTYNDKNKQTEVVSTNRYGDVSNTKYHFDEQLNMIKAITTSRNKGELESITTEINYYKDDKLLERQNFGNGGGIKIKLEISNKVFYYYEDKENLKVKRKKTISYPGLEEDIEEYYFDNNNNLVVQNFKDFSFESTYDSLNRKTVTKFIKNSKDEWIRTFTYNNKNDLVQEKTNVIKENRISTTDIKRKYDSKGNLIESIISVDGKINTILGVYYEYFE